MGGVRGNEPVNFSDSRVSANPRVSAFPAVVTDQIGAPIFPAMKLTVSIALLALLAAGTASAQDAHKPAAHKPKEGAGHHAMSGWKELDAYHELMAASWHPAKKDDLKPARAKADSLAAAAQVWAKSTAPHGCDAKPVKDAMADVVAGSAKFAQLAAKGTPDAELKTALHDLHERFEVVEKGCKPGHH
jgi:hypothetical protein